MANGGAEKLEVRNAVTKPLHAIPYASPPINEPVVLGASFVISTAEEMQQACANYRARPLDRQNAVWSLMAFTPAADNGEGNGYCIPGTGRDGQRHGAQPHEARA